MEQIGLSSQDGRFYDKEGEHIDVIFKLYPWEFIVNQEFGEPCFKDMENVGLRSETGKYIGGTVWFEAPYKMLWSNKALFAVLWDLFKDDTRSKWLLPTYFDNEVPASLTDYARKPIFAREGADIVLKANGHVIQDATIGDYGKEGYVVQELALLPEFKDKGNVRHYPVLGLWFVDGEPAGMGIREDETPITTNASKFIPHSIADVPVTYDRKPIPSLADMELSLSLDKYLETTTVDEFIGVLDYMQSAVLVK